MGHSALLANHPLTEKYYLDSLLRQLGQARHGGPAAAGSSPGRYLLRNNAFRTYAGTYVANFFAEVGTSFGLATKNTPGGPSHASSLDVRLRCVYTSET